MRVKEGGFHLHCLVGVHLFSFYFFSLPSPNLLSFLQRIYSSVLTRYFVNDLVESIFGFIHWHKIILWSLIYEVRSIMN